MRNKREMLYEAYWAIKRSRSERKSKKKVKPELQEREIIKTSYTQEKYSCK